MHCGCHLRLCNLADPSMCPPGRDLLALLLVQAGKEQVWMLLQPPPSPPLPLPRVSLSLGFSVCNSSPFLGLLYSPNCLLLDIENPPCYFRDMICRRRGTGFWVGRGASTAASWAPAPSCRLDVQKIPGSCQPLSSARVQEPRASRQLGVMGAYCPQRCCGGLALLGPNFQRNFGAVSAVFCIR